MPDAPVISIAISIAAVAVSFFSYKTSRNKLCLELFPKRYAIFESWKEFVLLSTHNEPVPNSKMSEFRRVVNDASFILPDLAEHLAEVHRKTSELNRLKTKRIEAEKKGFLPPETVDNRIFELYDWVSHELTSGSDRFKEYLAFNEKPIHWL